MPDFSGIAHLAVLGIVFLVVLAFALPMLGMYGLAWMLEPRTGAVVWTVTGWLCIGWALAVTAFFGTAFWPRR